MYTQVNSHTATHCNTLQQPISSNILESSFQNCAKAQSKNSTVSIGMFQWKETYELFASGFGKSFR